MTEDISALVARLKEAAGKATPGEWGEQQATRGRYIFVSHQKPEPERDPDDDTDGWEATIIADVYCLSGQENASNARHIATANPSAILSLCSAYETQAAELTEQCRLNGAGSEREAALMAGVRELERALDNGTASDGFHTFNELYEYRLLYNAALLNEWAAARLFDVHKSTKHFEGDDCFGGGWFVVSATLPTGQIGNHYELKHWDMFMVESRKVAAKWDGHSPGEAARRLADFIRIRAALHRKADGGALNETGEAE